MSTLVNLTFLPCVLYNLAFTIVETIGRLGSIFNLIA